jgi:hypothetical protein
MITHRLYEKQEGISLKEISEGDYLEFTCKLAGKVNRVKENELDADIIMPDNGMQVHTPFIKNAYHFSIADGKIYPTSRCSLVIYSSIDAKEFKQLQEKESELVKHLRIENGEGVLIK